MHTGLMWNEHTKEFAGFVDFDDSTLDLHAAGGAAVATVTLGSLVADEFVLWYWWAAAE